MVLYIDYGIPTSIPNMEVGCGFAQLYSPTDGNVALHQRTDVNVALHQRLQQRILRVHLVPTFCSK